MNYEAAFELVKGYLCSRYDISEEKIAPGANLFSKLGLDSIDALDMVGILEEELKVPVQEDELKALRTVEDIVQYVVRNAPARA